MVLDAVLILTVALFVFIGYKKGIVKSLYGVISLVVSGIGSYILGKFLSSWVYTFFFEKSINESINNSITATAESVTTSTENIFYNLPDYVKNFLGFFGIAEIGAYKTTGAIQTIETELQNAVRSTVVEILGFIFIVLLFILILFLMKILSKSILFIFEVPIIKQINGIFGMVFGLAEGLIICYIAVLACRLLLATAGRPVIDAEMINSSLIFSKIFYSDFITYITSVFPY